MVSGHRLRRSALVVGMLAAMSFSVGGVASAAEDPLAPVTDLVDGLTSTLTDALGSNPLGGLTDAVSGATTSPGTTTPEQSSTTDTSPRTTAPTTWTPPAPVYNTWVPSRLNLLDCMDFASRADAQAVLAADPSDPNVLDADRDGMACDAGVGVVRAAYPVGAYPVGGIAAGDGPVGLDLGQIALLAMGGVVALGGAARAGLQLAERRAA